jgi:RHS repeat-associated protein
LLQRVELTQADGTQYPVVQYSDDYNATGQIGTATYGNGSITTHEYWPGNFRLRYLRTQAYDQNNAWNDIQDLEYRFYDRGDIETITDNVHSATHSFTYDSVNRLESATVACAADPSRAYRQAFTYDLAGNMTSKSGPGGFDVVSWQDPDKHIRPKSIIYANQTTGVGQRDITYDQDNMPTQTVFNGTTSYLFYDGTGSRVKKVSGGQTTVYVGGLFEKRGGETVVHIFAGSQRVATIKGGQKYFTHGDHLGSTSLVTNDTGRLVEEIGYLPFGATLYRNAYQGGAWTSVYRFTGQEYDAEFALYNYNARLYDPVTCRFITADTVVPDWTNPQSLNRYAYCMNNPLKYVDPSGHFGWAAFGLFILYGALIGAAAGGMIAAIQGGNVWQGITQGAITGAISGAMFYAAGSAITWMAIEGASGPAFAAAQVALHATAGAASGAINASITGGDIGQGALIGGLSAGVAKGAEEFFGSGPVQRILIGSAMGGISSVASGGDFFQGAWQGAWTSAIALICNGGLHDERRGVGAFKTADDAAAEAMELGHKYMNQIGVEWGGEIYLEADGTYSYSIRPGEKYSVYVDKNAPGGVATWHAHPTPELAPHRATEHFSYPADFNKNGRISYLMTGKGNMLKYVPSNDQFYQNRGSGFMPITFRPIW